jgi:hypothetical protein
MSSDDLNELRPRAACSEVLLYVAYRVAAAGARQLGLCI